MGLLVEKGTFRSVESAGVSHGSLLIGFGLLSVDRFVASSVFPPRKKQSAFSKAPEQIGRVGFLVPGIQVNLPACEP